MDLGHSLQSHPPAYMLSCIACSFIDYSYKIRSSSMTKDKLQTIHMQALTMSYTQCHFLQTRRRQAVERFFLPESLRVRTVDSCFFDAKQKTPPRYALSKLCDQGYCSAGRRSIQPTANVLAVSIGIQLMHQHRAQANTGNRYDYHRKQSRWKTGTDLPRGIVTVRYNSLYVPVHS